MTHPVSPGVPSGESSTQPILYHVYHSVSGKTRPGVASNSIKYLPSTLHQEPRSQGGERYHNMSSREPSDRATASDRVLSSRVQKRPKKVSQKPVPGRPTATQKFQNRKQPQGLIGGLSGTPAVFNKAETFPWGSIKFTYPDGSVVDTSPPKEKTDISSLVNMPVEVITVEKFRVVAVLARNIKKLFPHENDGYWSTIVTGFQALEQKADQATKKTQGNIEYYELQLNLVLGIYPTLIKSISGFWQLYLRSSTQNSSVGEFAALRTKIWCLTYHVKSLSDLRCQFLQRSDYFRRLHFLATKLRLPWEAHLIASLARMSNISYHIARGLSYLVNEISKLKLSMIERELMPSEGERKILSDMVLYSMGMKTTMTNTFRWQITDSHSNRSRTTVAPVNFLP
ncbi:hypothetical protein TWF192_000943 [Orbilia oligospora]|uniref:Uncharacterized protein n=1 Tax=Orbilia oligospora TaxID=2813651 RepID=A0A6G1MIR9_ORBOL|nr:hypothetical protein TWF679_007842 [Orbilia oligospora]KAF3231501.1 hypothetical protein TWF191_005570 [Orbilia oligospora]KAF3257653.1 hypothetical protein TWF192_000943 [Orbilia oligospora]